MVYILLATGFEEAEALVPTDLLRRAGIDVALVSLEGTPVTGGQGMTVRVDRSLGQVDLRDVDMVVLPGGSLGVQNLGKHPSVAALVQEAIDRDIWLAAICAAPTLLARWGHLKGKRAVCYPGLEGRMADAVLQMDAGVVVDGKLITGRAAGSVFDFGLALVRALAGEEESEKVRHAVHY